MEELVQKCVSWMIRRHPWMGEYRMDLEQEARMMYLSAMERYDRNGGMEEQEKYVFFQIKHALQNYMRDEVKHWKKPLESSESPYWDLDDTVEPEFLPAEQVASPLRDLLDIAQGAELTPRQMEVLLTYLETDDVTVTAEQLGTTRQNVNQILQVIISKCKEVE